MFRPLHFINNSMLFSSKKITNGTYKITNNTNLLNSKKIINNSNLFKSIGNSTRIFPIGTKKTMNINSTIKNFDLITKRLIYTKTCNECEYNVFQKNEKLIWSKQNNYSNEVLIVLFIYFCLLIFLIIKSPGFVNDDFM